MRWANKKYYTNGEIRSVNPGFGAKTRIEIPLTYDDEPAGQASLGSSRQPVARCCYPGSLRAWVSGPFPVFGRNPLQKHPQNLKPECRLPIGVDSPVQPWLPHVVKQPQRGEPWVVTNYSGACKALPAAGWAWPIATHAEPRSGDTSVGGKCRRCAAGQGCK